MRFYVDELPKTQDECIFMEHQYLRAVSKNCPKMIKSPTGRCMDGQTCDFMGAGCHRLTVLNKDHIEYLSNM